MLLLTGASGFFGKIAFRILSKKYNTIGLAYSSNFNRDFIRFNLIDTHLIFAFLDKIKPNIIVHSAACRAPDICESDPDFVQKFNVEATSKIAEWCSLNNVKLVYISTDYVFDGISPPYSENDTPNPLNFYGKSKFMGELATQKCENSIIVRMPLQYGFSLPEKESFLLKVLNQFQAGLPIELDDSQFRFPTLSDDVAIAVSNLLQQDFSGIIHLSGSTKSTRFSMYKTIAEVFNFPTSLLLKMDLPEVKDAKRPNNSQLNTSLYESLCNHKFRSFRDGLEFSKKLMEKCSPSL